MKKEVNKKPGFLTRTLYALGIAIGIWLMLRVAFPNSTLYVWFWLILAIEQIILIEELLKKQNKLERSKKE